MEENKGYELEGKTLSMVRNDITALILVDRSFSGGECDKLLSELEARGYEVFEEHNSEIPMISDKYQDVDGESAPYVPDDFVDALDNLLENYSRQRYEEIKRIGMLVYPAEDTEAEGQEGVEDEKDSECSCGEECSRKAECEGASEKSNREGAIYIKITGPSKCQCHIIEHVKNSAKRVKKFLQELFK